MKIILEILITLILGTMLFIWGMRLGEIMLKKGATAKDLFKGKNIISLAVLGIYFCLLILAVNVPQMEFFPLEWRFYGMQVSWTLMRVILLLICGVAFKVSWHTARFQTIAVVLLALLGTGTFTSAEVYLLSPIHASLHDNLQPNGVFRQTSSSSCAPAALATVLRRWGIAATESSVAKLAGTSRLGTSMPQLIIAARSLGMDGLELSPTWEQMQQINRPGVLAVWLFDGFRNQPHAVALLAISADRVAIGDPARGRIYILDRARFAKIWRKQYVPIFRPNEIFLSNAQAAEYLYKLGYLKTSQALDELSTAIRRFQADKDLKATGELDPQTALMLSGAFGQGIPTLTQLQ